jgi:hypothetical protein
MKASGTEIRALEEADALLRFAAERVADLNPDLSLALAEARAAMENDRWTPQLAQRFWIAFAKLCDLVQPVTLDCLAEGRRRVPVFTWLPWRGREDATVAERSSRRYLGVLVTLLLLILPLQLYVWTVTSVSRKLEALIADEKARITRLTEGSAQFRVGQAKDTLHRQTVTAVIDLEQIGDTVGRLTKLTALNIEDVPELTDRGKDFIEEKDDADRADIQIFDFIIWQLKGARVIEKANLVTGIIGSFVLPILFGALGAVAYIVRSISDQIRNATFSSTSPIRHFMRVVLGVMAGVVVGLFGGLSNQLTLSPLAIAFLAGYGTEALFSMFDALIQKFRQAA